MTDESVSSATAESREPLFLLTDRRLIERTEGHPENHQHHTGNDESEGDGVSVELHAPDYMNEDASFSNATNRRTQLSISRNSESPTPNSWESSRRKHSSSISNAPST